MEQYWISLKVLNEEIFMKDFVQAIFSSIWIALIKTLHGVPEQINKIIITRQEHNKIQTNVNGANLILGDYVLKIINNQLEAFLNSLNDIPKDRSSIVIQIEKIKN